MIYRAMKILNMHANHNVIEYGEYGMTFYIILKGKVSVKIPVKYNREFTFKELWSFIIQNDKLIVKDNKFDKVLEIIQDLLPEVIETNKKKELSLDTQMLQDLLNSVVISKNIKKNGNKFPTFEEESDSPVQFDPDLIAHENTKSIELTILSHTTDLDVGCGFGELALINNVPRSATITTLEDCWFGTLDKADFRIIMGKIYKKKFANLIKIIDKVMIFNDLNRGTKE